MLTENDLLPTGDTGWVVRVKPPALPNARRTVLMIHGWTGDENSMWIFAGKIPANSWIFAPRGPIQSSPTGYGWTPHTDGLPGLEAFAGPAAALMGAFHSWRLQTGAPEEPPDVMGFSQGAAMAYALAAYYPDQVGRVIALAGYLPEAPEMPGRYAALRGKKIYIAHGTLDETIPVQLAQSAAQTLEEAGALVTYCQSEIGHKLSASCLKGLGVFAESQ